MDVARARLQSIWKPFKEYYLHPYFSGVVITFGNNDYTVQVLRNHKSASPSYGVKTKGTNSNWINPLSSANCAWAFCGKTQP